MAGSPALPGNVLVISPDGTHEIRPEGEHPARTPATASLVETGGGGGFGDPRARDAERVRDDVAQGLCLAAKLRATIYGVALE